MCIENNKSSENRLNPPIVADKPLGYASSRMASSMGMQPPKQEKLDSSRKTFPSTMISTKYYSYQDSYKSPGEEEVKEGNGKGKKRLVKEFIKIAKQNEEADEAGTSVSIENGDIKIGNNRINIGVSCNIETVKVDNEDTLMISSDEPIAVRVVPITLNTPMIITADSASSQSISGYDKILKVLGSNYCLSDVYGQCQPFGGRKSIPCQSFHNSN
ncbi:unnamed protein product [Moneuplotes crassus]|uniref:Uncharacterized protein n=1 Tax=Euplotes crassus TaxID=5936 RepID=A0AAD1UKC2_EUPCR|nr:unnamed protein product [Moneuplotes crassus]